MIAEYFEYHLQDLTDDPVYCPICGSCGEAGCCSPTRCVELKCMYGGRCVNDYHEAIDDTEKYFNLVVKLLRHIKNRTQNLYPSTGISKELPDLYKEYEIE